MASQVGLVYSAGSGTLMAVVVPDHDYELADPAYNQPGTIQYRLDLATFEGLGPDLLSRVAAIQLAEPGILPTP